MSKLILQLTDLHLFSDSSKRMRGVPPHDCLVDVLEHVQSSKLDPDLVVVSGDLAHDEQRATYRILRSLLAPWMDRLVIIPGNHDDRNAIRAVFPEQFCQSNCPEPFVTFSRRIDNWLILGLDTHMPGKVFGCMPEEQLAWAHEEMRRHGESPCMLFLHHPPVSIDCPWLDRLGLRKPEPLIECIERHPQISVIVAGHVHQEFTGEAAGRTFLTTPSTAMQFTPCQKTPAYDPIPCGYRIFEIEDTNWSSRVVRLPKLRFPPANSGATCVDEE